MQHLCLFHKPAQQADEPVPLLTTLYDACVHATSLSQAHHCPHPTQQECVPLPHPYHHSYLHMHICTCIPAHAYIHTFIHSYLHMHNPLHWEQVQPGLPPCCILRQQACIYLRWMQLLLLLQVGQRQGPMLGRCAEHTHAARVAGCNTPLTAVAQPAGSWMRSVC
jgi:hypothetical protein